MAGKSTPPSHKPPCQGSQAPITLTSQWKREGGRDGGKDKCNHTPRRQDGWVIPATMTACDKSNAPAQGICPLTT